MDKETLILIAGQLTKDKLSRIEMHEQLIENLGNTQEAEDYVYHEHLGEYIQILENVINKISVCVIDPEEQITQQEYVIISAQLQSDKKQMDNYVLEIENVRSMTLDMHPHDHERFMRWESELLESLIRTFQTNFSES